MITVIEKKYESKLIKKDSEIPIGTAFYGNAASYDQERCLYIKVFHPSGNGLYFRFSGSFTKKPFTKDIGYVDQFSEYEEVNLKICVE